MKRAAGFTIIEMVVAMAIFALLIALTVPTMRTWVANTKVRAAADLLQNGIRLAQTEALRRGRQVVFSLTNTANPVPGFTGCVASNCTPGIYWAAQTIPVDPSEAAVIVGSGPVTAAGSPITVTAPPVGLCFNSVGRLVTQTSPGIAGVVCISPIVVVSQGVTMWTYVVSEAPLSDHPMTVEVAMGGQLHLCDPTQTLSATNPYGC
jgi:type IV fimbrial biogenesis protein FimT